MALVPAPAGCAPWTSAGVRLPLDPSRTPVDAPVVIAAPREPRCIICWAQCSARRPRLYARLSSVRAAGSGRARVQIADLPVRAMTNVTLARLADIEPVERDLARRQLRAAELDLRYRDQVIARLP